MSDTTQEQATAPAQTPVGLNVQDLILMVKLIHIGTERGTWKADELTTVGGVFERLVSFLESVGAVTRTPVTGTDPAPATTDTGVTTETVTTTPEVKENSNAKARSEAQ
jgi:hypothetical protein